MVIGKYEAVISAAEAIIADLSADRQVNITEAVKVMDSLNLVAKKLFDRSDKIKMVEYPEHRPQDPSIAIPPLGWETRFVSFHWRSFVNKQGETVRYINEFGWRKQAEYFDSLDADCARFCRECETAAAHYRQRCHDVKAALGITALNDHGQQLDDLRYKIEDLLLDSRAQDFDHLAVKAQLVQRFSIDAASVCADTICLLAVDTQRLLEPTLAKSHASAAAA